MNEELLVVELVLGLLFEFELVADVEGGVVEGVSVWKRVNGGMGFTFFELLGMNREKCFGDVGGDIPIQGVWV